MYRSSSRFAMSMPRVGRPESWLLSVAEKVHDEHLGVVK